MPTAYTFETAALEGFCPHADHSEDRGCFLPLAVGAG